MTNGYNIYPPRRDGNVNPDRVTRDGRGHYGMGSGNNVVYQQPPVSYASTGRGQAGGMPAPAPEVQASPTSKKRKHGAAFWVALIVILICIALAAALLYTTFGSHKGSRTGVPGQLEGKTPEEVQAELNRVVEEGMFNISIASAITFANGQAPGELRIENVPGNIYLMRVEIMLDDTGQMVYQTDFIEPNNHIQEDTLDVDLEPGTYDATAMFYAYDPETEEEVGRAAAKITLLVQG